MFLAQKVQKGKVKSKRSLKAIVKSNWQLYVLILPAVLYLLVFDYMPMYGVQIAFKDFKAVKGILGSEWVGLKHFKDFFNAYYFKRLLSNTLLLNVYSLLWGAPIPVILAVLLNHIRSARIKKFVQTTIYVPYFVSTIVLAGMLYLFLSPTSGIFNFFLQALGFKAVDFMSEASAFRTIYILSGLWQTAGYSSILYVAALSGVDPALYEAAEIDGASILQKIRHIDLPVLVPTAVMVFILDCGKILNSNTDKALALQTAGNITTSDILGTYVYNMGLGKGQFSYTAAIGLFINVINFILVVAVNKIAKKSTGTGMF